MQLPQELQIVYVLTNPAMPDMVKIGMTKQSDITERLKQLYTTGVPMPFDCAYACKVTDASVLEAAMHLALDPLRVNKSREFFRVKPENIIPLLKLHEQADFTVEFEAKIEAGTPSADLESAEAYKRTMRPRMNFFELGIPSGSVLDFRTGLTQCQVVDYNKVSFAGERCSLTHATRKALGLPSGYPLQPSPHWLFQGKSVKTIYEEFHLDDEI